MGSGLKYIQTAGLLFSSIRLDLRLLMYPLEMVAFLFAVLVAVLFQQVVFVIPLEDGDVEVSKQCPPQWGGKSPCACGDRVGLRYSQLFCNKLRKWYWNKPDDPKDGQMAFLL
ncbi:hypothetical protein E1B28_009582 [Marasmius oreades]|uniref:Uncharacterized protein n=1 Tax=Marasmius oreades TaxID=181124 RepID=A0A9P7UQ91_9AGAR|nr:uncharacterized protein E1B28_009582 [Marasmius oreades]KAG7090467.1 hypothetical protein E1B28_009582 [Marasmius oreades]